MKRTVKVLVSLGILTGAAFLLIHTLAPDDRQPAPLTDSKELAVNEGQAARCVWVPAAGQRAFYRLSWQSAQQRWLQAAAEQKQQAPWLSSTSKLKGRLSMQASASGTCSAWVRLDEIEQAQFELGGDKIQLPATELSQTRVLASWAPNGALAGLRFAEETSYELQNLFNALLTELQFVMPDSGELLSGRGRARTETEVADDGWRRRKVAYLSLKGISGRDHKQDLSAATELSLNADQTIRRLQGDERLQVSDGKGQRLMRCNQQLRVEWLEGKQATSEPRLALGPVRQAGQVLLDPSTQQSLLRQRAGKMTAAKLLAQLRSAAADSDQGAFLWQATALLQLDPSLADQVAETLMSPVATQSSRELGMDLLAHSGQPADQEAMRRVLSAPALQAEPRANLVLLQRFSFVAHPDAASQSFVRDQVAGGSAPSPQARKAAMFVLGSMAGHLRDNGREQEAAPHVALLSEQAGATAATETRRAAIAGLGNAHDPASLSSLLQASQDDVTVLRGAAATALRHYDSLEVTTRLVEMCGDSSGLVQRSALLSLTNRHLGGQQLSVIRDHLRTERLARINQAMLVGLLQKHRKSPVARESLELVLQHSHGDAKLRARIRNILQH